jgi:hypothetical protein
MSAISRRILIMASQKLLIEKKRQKEAAATAAARHIEVSGGGIGHAHGADLIMASQKLLDQGYG